jgi:hypothetical protein
MLSIDGKKEQLRAAILKTQKTKLWVKDTPEHSGHIINPYAILEDAQMKDYVYGLNEEQNLLIASGINAITRVEILNERFSRPSNWKEKIDLTKFSISTE